ncbi:MAG TPA: hypothetical protein VIK28_09345 [Sedimentisphaerales bacterium]
MGISFHCELCGKKIEAPDTAGGKWGKCPACHNKVYVPANTPPDDELRLAPIDTEEERRRKKMAAEVDRLREKILDEKDVPEEGVVPKDQPAAPEPGDLSNAELTTFIISYLRQMADGELDLAEQTAKTILSNGQNAIRPLEKIALSEIPEPEIADIPQQVLSGLIKSLRNRIR